MKLEAKVPPEEESEFFKNGCREHCRCFLAVDKTWEELSRE
jgi:hypothetical protein